jgi:hypothetical protein
MDQNSLQNDILQLCNEEQQLILEKVKRSPEILFCKVQKASQNMFNIYVHYLLVLPLPSFWPFVSQALPCALR